MIWGIKMTIKKSDRYVPLGSRNIELRMEAILSKLVKVHESWESFLKDIKADISGLNQKVKPYATPKNNWSRSLAKCRPQ